MWTILKVLIEFVTILLLLFMFWFFGGEAPVILASSPPALEGEVNHRTARESPCFFFMIPIF